MRALRRSAQMSAAARRPHLAQSSSLFFVYLGALPGHERLLRKGSGIGLQGGSAPPARTVLAPSQRAHSVEVTSSPEPGGASAGRDPPATFMCMGAHAAHEFLSAGQAFFSSLFFFHPGRVLPWVPR